MMSTAMLGASMPEASIDENRESLPCEYHISPSVQSGLWSEVNSVPQPKPMKLSSKTEFRFCSRFTNGLHPSPNLRR